MNRENAPIILADRHEVVFVAAGYGTPVHALETDAARVVTLHASDEEIASAEGTQVDPGSWESAAPRPDLLGNAISRMLDGRSGAHPELDIQPARDGLKVRLITSNGEAEPVLIAARDAIGFLAAVFGLAPRGIAPTGIEHPRNVLLEVRPSARRHAYNVRCIGVTGETPGDLSEAGLASSQLEQLRGMMNMTPALLLVSGGPGAGCSTTLGLIASALAGAGRHGGSIGETIGSGPEGLSWLSPSVRLWPFPQASQALAPDFVIIDDLHFDTDIAYAARLAASGRLVVAGVRDADPEVLARAAVQRLEASASTPVPIAVLSQSLVRTVCPDCTTWTNVPIERARRIGFHPGDLQEFEKRGGLMAARGQGCGTCSGTGAAGLTGVYDFVAPGETRCSLPRKREDAWTRVLEGQACIDDVAALPMGGTTMRQLCGQTARRSGCEEPQKTSPAEDSAAPIAQELDEESLDHTGPEAIADLLDAEPVPEHAGEPDTSEDEGSPLDDADRLSALLQDAHAGSADAGVLEEIVQGVITRAQSGQPIQDQVALSRGFHLARHSVNTAAIAVRIASEWDTGFDLTGVARLGLLHDVGLVQAGVDPSADLPATVSKGSLDQTGTRWKPEPMLKAFGLESSDLANLIRQVHKLFTPRGPAGEETPETDSMSQVVALASLVESESHGTVGGRAADLHDATTIIMERHRRSFHHALFRALLQAIPIFPIDSLVELSSGDLARIVGLNDENQFRPRVEIIAVHGAQGLPKRVVDLARAPFLHIRQRVIDSDSMTAS